MQTSEQHIKLSRLLTDSKERKDICIQLLLTWLASIDGAVSHLELDRLEEAFPASLSKGYFKEYLFMCQDGRYLELQMACDVLRQSLNEDEKRKFLSLAFNISMADNILSFQEQLVLHFLGDLLGFTLSELQTIFQEQHNLELPPLGDPSSVQWWNDSKSEAEAAPAGVKISDD